MPTNKKGARRERELVNLLDERGFAVMRAPSSGSATERELPDVLAGNGHAFWAIEAKASGGDPIYLEASGEDNEIDNLRYFAKNFGAAPLVGVKFDPEYGDVHYGNDDDTGWRFYHPEHLYETDGGNLRVKKEDMDEGLHLDHLWNSA